MAYPPYSIRELKSGDLAVLFPYTPPLIRHLKHLMAIYKDVTIQGEPQKAWTVKPEHRAKVEALLAEYFPPEDQLIEQVISYTCESRSYQAPQIDGVDLLRFSQV
jgi:hypothetical protein